MFLSLFTLSNLCFLLSSVSFPTHRRYLHLAAKPKLAKFNYYAKTELYPPMPTDIPAIVSGFGKPNGRATDAVFAPDGRLFIADDTTGKIYWVAPRTLAAPK